VIRRSCDLALGEAKSCTDRVLDGQPVEVQVRDPRAARELVRELHALGAIAEVMDDSV
jgi:hypothetical protein